MAKIGTAFIEVVPDFDTFNKKVDTAASTMGVKLGGKAKVAAAGIAGLALAGGVAAKALYNIGEQFDDAYDTIRTGTGKTGKELDGLKQSFKNVVSSVPASFGDAGKAISQVNQRLGLTGKPLETLSKQFLELSRITGTDLSTNIETATRVFGDWAVKVKDQPKVLDKLFRASQSSGVGIDKLSAAVVKFGAPLRQLGFGFDQSVAMIAKFEKEGVNTNLVMGSMRIALGKIAKSADGLKEAQSSARLAQEKYNKAVEEFGKNSPEALYAQEKLATAQDRVNDSLASADAPKYFREVVQEIKNAGSASKANALALEIFGAKAGPDMAAAIREGRLEVGDLQKVIANGGDTIMKAGKDTQDFAEKWKVFKNWLMVQLEPAATWVFNQVGKAMDKLPGLALKLKASLAPTVASFRDFAVTVWPAVKIALEGMKGALEGVAQQAKGFLSIFKGLLDFFVGVFTLDFGRAWKGIEEIVGGTLTSIGGFLKGFTAPFRALADKLFGGVFDAAKKVGGKMLGAGKWLVEQAIKGIKSYVSALGAVGSWVTDRIANGIKTITGPLRSVGDWIKDRVVNFIKARVAFWKDVGTWVIDRIANGIKTITGPLASVGEWVKDRVVNGIKATVAGFKDVGEWIIDRVANGVKTVTNALGSVGEWIRGRIGSLVHAVGEDFKKVGSGIVGFIVDGMKGAAHLFAGFVNKIIDIINKIPGVPNIGHVAFAQGGQYSATNLKALGLAQGGIHAGTKLTSPIVMMGEEAPRHPEYVIPTNPAYRKRALGLYSQLGQELGSDVVGWGLAQGGTFSRAGGASGGGFGLPSPRGLGWLAGTGSYIVSKVAQWIPKQIANIAGGVFKGLFGHVDLDALPKVLGPLTRMVDRMNKIDKMHKPYLYGGGHGGWGNGPWDCSGLVSDILHAGGLLGSPITTDGLKVFGEKGDGKFLTIGVRGSTGANAHTMMKLGNRYLESGSGHGAQWTSGWAGRGFPIHRHPKGFAEGGVFGAPFVGSYASGGIVPRDGYAYVHQGETITPGGLDGARMKLIVGNREFDAYVDARVDENDRAKGAAYRAGAR